MIKNATCLRLFAACMYELLVLFALWMLCTWVFVRLFGDARHDSKRLLLQFFLWLMTGAYFVWCWVKSGQTLAAKTWKIKLVNAQNTTLSMSQALIRYALGSISLLACGLGYVWIFVDKEGLFLHDRLLKTRFICLA